MAKFFIDTEGDAFSAVQREALENALGAFVDSDVPLAIEFTGVDEAEIRSLNAQTRGVDSVTDVLSFPTLDGIKGQRLQKKDFPYDIDEAGRLVIGSVVVCDKRAHEQAEAYGHSYARELHYLLVHGVMHCLGYDHIEEQDRAEMREKEEQVLSALGIVRE